MVIREAQPPPILERIKMKTYQFDVPCVYYYEIDAETEKQARQILISKGGIDIEGDLLLEQGDYKQAKLVGVLSELKTNQSIEQ